MKTITKFIYPAFVALALAVGALTLKAAPGDLYVADLTNGTTGLAFDSAGNLFAGDYTGGNILKFTPNGTQSIFASGAGNVAGLAFDSAGNLFAGDYTGGNIFKFTPDGTQSTFA